MIIMAGTRMYKMEPLIKMANTMLGSSLNQVYFNRNHMTIVADPKKGNQSH